MRGRTSVWALALVAVLGLMVTSSVGAKPRPATAPSAGILSVGTDLNEGVPLPVVGATINGRARSVPSVQAGLKLAARTKAKVAAKRVVAKKPSAAVRGAAARKPSGRSGARRLQSHTPTVGENRLWVGYDDTNGILYVKNYQLRGIGEHIEVWVAEGMQGPRGLPASNDLEFLPGDCRNGVRTQVTDEQVAYLIDEFDNNIYPKESAAFSVPPDRDGSDAVLGAPFHPGGDGDNIVVLIDNVRDDNFYDFNNTQGHSYIAGFFSSQINNLFDRNIMTIDGWDWIHRTGANPPHEPVPGDLCRSATARPFLYEGVFAHEYQHLLMEYEDPDEVNWVNEGLSDWAQTLTGYVDPARPITEIGFDSHIQCFLGWMTVQTFANPNPNPNIGGPENSLTLWGDQGPAEILCDYGAAYTFMELLAGRYGPSFMSALHRHDANGLEGLDAILAGAGGGAMEHIRDWAAAVALDGVLDDGATLVGGNPAEYQVPTLDARINWDNPHAYSTPGAPPNGSDYVRLRDADGNYIVPFRLHSLSFNGASTLPSLPVEWTVDQNPPMHAGDPALYSGTGNNLDRAIIREVSVPAGNASLTFESIWNIETGWDFGVVQVSTDGGATYTSISCTDTTSEHDPGAIARIVAELPGFTGYSGGWRNETCSLAAYAGQTVLLSFRYLTDPAVQGQVADIPPGWWIDDVAVGGTLISDGSSLEGWQSATQVRPIPVPGFTVQVITYNSNAGGFPLGLPHTVATIDRLSLDANFDATIVPSFFTNPLALQNDVVAAIVTFEDPSETITQYAPYVLRANGVVQPGGS